MSRLICKDLFYSYFLKHICYGYLLELHQRRLQQIPKIHVSLSINEMRLHYSSLLVPVKLLL